MVPKVGIVMLNAPNVSWPCFNIIPALVPAVKVKLWLKVTPAGLSIVIVVPFAPHVAASTLPVTCAVVPL